MHCAVLHLQCNGVCSQKCEVKGVQCTVVSHSTVQYSGAKCAQYIVLYFTVECIAQCVVIIMHCAGINTQC